MKSKTSQSGFTLIELIAVMVILGILAAVIVPRIATLTSGAYESNVRSMFGVIKNEVNAQALKAAMTGGASGHRETYPEGTSTTKNTYLAEWVEDFESDYWSNYLQDNNYTNTNKVADAHAKTAAILFMYHPHGELSNGKVKWGAADVTTGGSSAMLEDNYWIYYAPITTSGGKTAGRDKDGYILAAFKDDGDAKFEATFSNGVVTHGGETELTDIQWITP